jgi:hypothetical protein
MSDARKMAGNPNSADSGNAPGDGRGGAGDGALAHGVTDAGNRMDSGVNLGDGVRGSVGNSGGGERGTPVLALRPAPLAPHVARIPASIVKAICQIKSTVDAVKKTQKNAHGGYMFASTDDIYAALTRKMGEVGLSVFALENSIEVRRVERDGKTAQWLSATYNFVFATETDTWSHPQFTRTVIAQITGPQTFQAAQSFAEKAMFRSVFSLPTGDMDLDSMPQADTEEDQNDLLAPRKRKSSSAAKRDGTTDIFNDIRGAISGADGPADLHLIKKQHWSVWQAMPTRWLQILDAEFEDKLAEFDSPDLSQE